jgi:hypothetical protein
MADDGYRNGVGVELAKPAETTRVTSRLRRDETRRGDTVSGKTVPMMAQAAESPTRCVGSQDLGDGSFSVGG